MDAGILASALMQHLMNIESRWCNESYTSLCHNVTQVVTWPFTSYGGAGDKSPAPRAPINRFAKKNSFRFNIEIEKPTHWFNFWTSVILSVTLRAESPSIFLDERSKETLLAGYLSVWPNDDNHYTFSVFTLFSSENVRSCWYGRGCRYAIEIHFFSLPLSAVRFS